MIEINVARDFTRFPTGRRRPDGQYSGEALREDHLVRALRAGSNVVVKLDGVAGYGSAFLEEAFGGLVQSAGFDVGDLEARLKLETEDDFLKNEIWSYIYEASVAAARMHTR